jgi:hypothetical protein
MFIYTPFFTSKPYGLITPIVESFDKFVVYGPQQTLRLLLSPSDPFSGALDQISGREALDDRIILCGLAPGDASELVPPAVCEPMRIENGETVIICEQAPVHGGVVSIKSCPLKRIEPVARGYSRK